MNVLLLHGYSARNSGDGLLVEESINLLREAYGDDLEVLVLARDSGSFEDLPVRVLSSRLLAGRVNWSYLRTLARVNKFDLLVAVGGGYLRFGTPVEALKTALAHGPQVLATALSKRPSVYLPQSVGPIRFAPRRLVRKLLSRLDILFARDGRTVSELGIPNAVRTPDLALLSDAWASRASTEVDDLPVLTVRHVRGSLPSGIARLATLMTPFAGYVQSRGSGNDDERAVADSGPAVLLDSSALMSHGGVRRVVVAVRLHAALMALQAGHWVVHLAYERKGYGAFEDLGLGDYVHSVNHFDVDQVFQQVQGLLQDEARRQAYDRQVASALDCFANERRRVVDRLRVLAARSS